MSPIVREPESGKIRLDFTINIPVLIAIFGVVSTLAVSVYRIGALESKVEGISCDLKAFAKDVATATATLEGHIRTDTPWPQRTTSRTTPGAN